MEFCNTDDTADSGSSSDRPVSQPDEQLHQPTNHSNVSQLLGYLLGGHLVVLCCSFFWFASSLYVPCGQWLALVEFYSHCTETHVLWCRSSSRFYKHYTCASRVKPCDRSEVLLPSSRHLRC